MLDTGSGLCFTAEVSDKGLNERKPASKLILGIKEMRVRRRCTMLRRCAAVVAGLSVIVIAAFLIYFPGRQSLLALTLASGLGIDGLQARVDALEEKAITGEGFTETDRAFLRDLYTCFAKGARLTFILRQSGQLMGHYLSRTGEPLRIESRLFLGSRRVKEQMDLLRQRVVEDVRLRGTLAAEYSSDTFHMGDPELLDSSIGLYFGRISVRPHLLDNRKLLLHWRADMPWQWPSYESLYDKYGDYHAQCFPVPNARSVLQGPRYYLWMDDGLGEQLARIGQAEPFLVWSEWDEEAEVHVDINQDDEMVIKLVRRYNLEGAIVQYDLVINAIERYHIEHGAYPPNLAALVPEYLPKVPGIYVKAGETLNYSAAPEHVGGAPFTFYIYGHHTGLQFMHGWELKYCPADLDFCGEANDRHYHPHRINDRWIWINSSAL